MLTEHISSETNTMASAGFAIELPTNRQSRYFDGPGPNIHDPNYIPVLNGADPRVDFSQPSFSALPSIPTPHQNESQTSLKRSKSASAPETIERNHAIHLMPTGPIKTLSAFPQEIGSSHQPDAKDIGSPSSVSGDNATSSSGASTTGPTTSALQENVFMIPGNFVPKAEEIQFPTLPVPASARSSISLSTTRKSTVPTSKYSKKNSNAPNPPPKAAQVAEPPPSSRGASPDFVSPESFESARSTPVPLSSAEPSPMLPSAFQAIKLPIQPSPATSPNPATSSSTSPPTIPAMSGARLQAMKSTASERRQRALHSHPSHVPMKSRSRKSSIVEETDEVPLITQSFRAESRASSIRSRTQSICNSTQPTPAPNAPLPDLPPTAKRPPTREKPIDKPFPIANPSPLSVTSLTKPQNDHVEMAEFVTTQKTTVFRRFDQVHVRLLLHLQDEISGLEKSLKEVEESGTDEPDQNMNKTKIMTDLRKVLAEYDHLFANWSSMQANKATPEMKRELEIWLQNPKLGSGKISPSAIDDLEWLHSSKDLSSVSIDPEKRPLRAQSSESLSQGSSTLRARGNGGGGFLSLFGCASRRK